MVSLLLLLLCVIGEFTFYFWKFWIIKVLCVWILLVLNVGIVESKFIWVRLFI